MRTNYYLNDEYLPEAIERVNVMKRWINSVQEDIQKIILSGKLIRNGEALDKRTTDKVCEIIQTEPKNVRAHLRVDYNSISLTVDVAYKNSDYSCKYVKDTAYLASITSNGLVPLELTERETDKMVYVTSNIEKYNKIADQISKLENSLNNVARNIRNYTDR